MDQRDAGGMSGTQESTSGRVKEQTTQVMHGATQTGQQVAHTTADQGRQVMTEAGRQARGLLDQARSELQGQAADQQKRAAQGLRAIGDQLRSMAEQAGEQDTARDLVQQASERAHQVAGWLDQREPGQVVEEVRGLARRHPGAFLASAAVAGVLAGRLSRNMTGAASAPQASASGAQTAGGLS
jgi:hypothetical protein